MGRFGVDGGKTGGSGWLSCRLSFPPREAAGSGIAPMSFAPPELPPVGGFPIGLIGLKSGWVGGFILPTGGNEMGCFCSPIKC